jgi:hypothetical protein
MFTSGSAIPLDHTVALLKKVADVIETMPNRIGISGQYRCHSLWQSCQLWQLGIVELTAPTPAAEF